MNLNQINQRIQEIEQDWKDGGEDYLGATYSINEALQELTPEDDSVIHFKDFKMEEGKSAHHIPSGIAELDEMTGGFGKGDLILISGDTGDGKTTFARFLVRKFSEQKKKCLVFSYEETNQEFLEKFVGDLPDGYIPKVLTHKSPVWIDAKILEAKQKFGVEVVFIDNLKGIVDHESRRSEVGEVDSIIQRLKAIAMKYNIVLFLLAHIKKLDSGLIDKNSLTGSKTIVDTASVGIALTRIKEKQPKKVEEEEGKKYTNYTSFYLIKNRYKGGYKNFTILFHPDTGNYSEKIIVEKDEIKYD